MNKQSVSLVAAIGARTRALGKNGDLLWHIPEDIRRFKNLTIGHPIIMGRKTWESIPEKFRPLKERTNIVVTRNTAYKAEGATVCSSFEEALLAAADATGKEEVFVIGGGELYALALPYAKHLYLTLVDDEKEGDTFFPKYEDEFKTLGEKEKHTQDNLSYQFATLTRK